MVSPRSLKAGLLTLLCFALSPSAAAQTGPSITAGGVANAADYSRDLSPGVIFAIFGRNFAASTISAQAVPLPESLGGVSVEIVSGATVRKARLFFVSAGQINAQMPFAVVPGDVRVRVRTAAGVSNEITAAISARSPRLFTTSMDGKGQPALLHADYRLVTQSAPALPGETLLAYLTGLGGVTPAGKDGEGGGDGTAARPLNLATRTVGVTVGGAGSAVLFAGLAPYFPGLYQVNFMVPAGTPAGLQTLQVFSDRGSSQPGVAFHVGTLGNPEASGEITSAGGTLRSGALTLKADAGAFSTSSTVRVYRAAAGADALGDAYMISGLPWPLAGAVTFTFTTPRPAQGDVMLRARITGLAGATEGDVYLPATVQGNQVAATLNAASSAALARNVRLAGRPYGANFSVVLEIKEWMVGLCQTPPLFVFMIPRNKFPTINQPAYCALYNYLQSAYTNLRYALNLDMTRLKSPVRLVLDDFQQSFPLRSDNQSVTHGSFPYPGVDQSIELNLSTWSSTAAKTLEVLMHRDLMGMMLNAYAPSRGIDAQDPLFWLSQAIRTWFERWPVEQVPYGVRPEFEFLLRGGLECQDCDEKSLQNHGAGAAMFLEFLGRFEPSKSIGLLIKLLEKHPAEPISALKEMIQTYWSSTIQSKWRDFCEEWMAGTVYRNSFQGTTVFPTPAAIAESDERDIIFFAVDNDKVVRRWQADDLSARLYELRLPWMPGPTKLRLALGPAGDETAGFVYALESKGNWRKLASFRNSTVIDDVHLLRNAGTRVFMLVANGRALYPYTNTHTVDVTAELAPLWAATSACNQAHFGIDGPFVCTTTPSGSCTPPISSVMTHPGTLPTGVRTDAGWAGNIYLATRRYTQSNIEYSLQVTAGMASDGASIVTASVRYVERSLTSDYNRTLDFAVSNIPFFRAGLNEVYYELEGREVPSHVSRFSFREFKDGKTSWDVTGVTWTGSARSPRIYLNFSGAPW